MDSPGSAHYPRRNTSILAIAVAQICLPLRIWATAVAHPSHPALRPPNGTGCEEAPVARGVSTQVAVNTVAAVREDDGGFNGDSDHRVDLRVAEWILPAPLITPDETHRFWRLRSPRSVYRYAFGVVTAAKWYPD